MYLDKLRSVRRPPARRTGDLKKVSGFNWMRQAEDCVLSRKLGVAYVQRPAVVECKWLIECLKYVQNTFIQMYPNNGTIGVLNFAGTQTFFSILQLFDCYKSSNSRYIKKVTAKNTHLLVVCTYFSKSQHATFFFKVKQYF